MGLKYTYIMLLIISLLGGACSSSKWVVVDQYATDRNDFELLDSEFFLTRTGEITPDNPIAFYELKAANTFEYAQRVQTDRYIQRYTPSLRSILIGSIGAGLATASAVSTDNPGFAENILYATAGFVVLTSFLNMNPTGEPTSTGETRLLRKTGTIQETDTVTTDPIAGVVPSYTIYDSQEILALGNDIPFINGRYTINLLDGLNPETFEYGTDEFVTLEIIFNDQIYVEDIPLASIFERFVVVSSEVTALRDEPVLDSRSILTDLAEG
ncbi:MAG: hypothetical protein MI700_05585, partial [Balneolales bacterium]|nr:hypothetical protein [Balneolales bacterium]